MIRSEEAKPENVLMWNICLTFA